MTDLGSIDWDESKKGFQHKLGYCECGKKILATSEELDDIIAYYGTPGLKRRVTKSLAQFFIRRLT